MRNDITCRRFNFAKIFKAQWVSLGLVFGNVALSSRGVKSGLSIGNTDVQGHVSKLKFHSDGIEVFRSFAYDFTLSLGSVNFDHVNFLNPFSLAVYFSSIESPFWLYDTLVIASIGLISAKKFSSVGALSGSATISTMFAAVWLINYSSLRVSLHTDFGGPNQAFVIVLAYLLLAIVPWSAKCELGGRRLLFFGLVLFWAVHGSSSSQSMLPWMLLCSLAPLGIRSITPKVRFNWALLTRVPLLFGASIMVSAIVSGSPVLTIMSTRRFTADSPTWGYGSKKATFLNSWSILGSTTTVRVLVVLSLLAVTIFGWGGLSDSAKAFIKRFCGLLILLQLYSITFFVILARLNTEIGPKPSYVAEAVGIPWLSVVVGLSGASGLHRAIAWIKSRPAPLIRQSDIVNIALTVLVLLWITIWIVRNPRPTSLALARTSELQHHPHFAQDWRLEGLSEARVLLVDRGSAKTEEGFRWVSVLFNNTLSRNRPQDVIVYADYSNSIPRWTSWIFEEFASNSEPTYSSLLWARTFNTDFVSVLRPTHVLSDHAIDGLGPDLLDSPEPSRDGFLYQTNFAENWLPDGTVDTYRRASDAITATRQAFMATNAPRSQVQALYELPRTSESVIQSVVIRSRYISVKVSSQATGLLRLPMEFSNCHYLVQSSNSDSSAKLIPIDGRFLGLHYERGFQGEIRFHSFGYEVLKCQLKDFLETRILP